MTYRLHPNTILYTTSSHPFYLQVGLVYIHIFIPLHLYPIIFTECAIVHVFFRYGFLLPFGVEVGLHQVVHTPYLSLVSEIRDLVMLWTDKYNSLTVEQTRYWVTYDLTTYATIEPTFWHSSSEFLHCRRCAMVQSFGQIPTTCDECLVLCKWNWRSSPSYAYNIRITYLVSIEPRLRN